MPEPGADLAGPPSVSARRRISVFIAVILLLQIIAPSSYYVARRDGDERFAWRMFSSLDSTFCTVQASETIGLGAESTTRSVSLESTIQRSWILLLRADRPALADRFLAWRCEQTAAVQVQYELTCTAPDGSPVAPVQRRIDCASGSIRTPPGGP